MESPTICQPDKTKSCGACCGLYNCRHETRSSLEKRLRRRTEVFCSIGQPDSEQVAAFSNWVRSVESQDKLLATIYNCEFLGFLDSGNKRVGCLLHPARNEGQDLRSCSFYGADLCAGHICLSHQKLTPEEKACVIQSLDDWYLYGICITDIDFCKSFFLFASAELGGQPPLPVLRHDKVKLAARDFFSLKVNWAFQTKEEGRFGKYCLAEDEYREARISYARLGMDPSPYDAILLSLESHFENREQLREAEEIIEQRIACFVKACRTS